MECLDHSLACSPHPSMQTTVFLYISKPPATYRCPFSLLEHHPSSRILKAKFQYCHVARSSLPRRELHIVIKKYSGKDNLDLCRSYKSAGTCISTMSKMDVLAICGGVLIKIATRGRGSFAITESVEVAGSGDLVLQMGSCNHADISVLWEYETI